MLKTFLKPATRLVLALTLSASAVTTSAAELSPYEARYTLDWASGVSFSGDAVRKLSRSGSRWLLETDASAMFASLSESSRFSLSPSIQPQRYTFQRKVLGKKRSAELKFDWANGQVTNNVNGQPWKMDIQPGVLDKLSVQLQLRLDLKAGKTRLSYTVADGGKLKTYRFRVEGSEQVTTPAGSFKAVKVARDRGENSVRKTWIWFAPEIDHMIVKIHQIEKEGKGYQLVLKEIKR